MASVQTKDYIVQLIKEEILSGVMKPGEELAQEALAERLGVSRMPIREALQNLVQEGFAVRLPNRHIQAVVLSAQQIHDVFHVIAAMAAENTILVAKKEQMLRRKNVEQTSQTEFEEDGQSKLFLEQEIENSKRAAFSDTFRHGECVETREEGRVGDGLSGETHQFV